MLVKEAKAAARQWVIEEGQQLPGFSGAFYHGSINWLADDAVLLATSDLDVMLVASGPSPLDRRGKFRYRGVLLEVSSLSRDQLQSPEQVLGLSHLAGSFRIPSVIADPSGELTRLQALVSREYARRHWVRQRCEHARSKIRGNLQSLKEAELFHDQVLAWLFATGVTTHVLLVAGLKNPTVRRRYVAGRELLAEYGQPEFYEILLELLGCAAMSRARVEEHLTALTLVFDAAQAAIRTPFPFAADISDVARPVAIEGSRELIERGCHREAMFWIAVTYSRCQKILFHDAPVETQARFDSGYHPLLADLGIRSPVDLQKLGDQVREFLPRLWEVAEVIMAANRDIED